jgi:hypothetical protein
MLQPHNVRLVDVVNCVSPPSMGGRFAKTKTTRVNQDDCFSHARYPGFASYRILVEY